MSPYVPVTEGQMRCARKMAIEKGISLGRFQQELDDGGFALYLDSLRPIALLAAPIVHDDLIHVSTFGIEVPIGFTLDACPRTGFSFWNPNTTDANFPHGLTSGKRYAAEVYRLKCDKTSWSIVNIGLANKRVLGGARGGALLCSHYRSKLPKDAWVIVIDEEKKLWRNDGDPEVSDFGWRDGGWFFNLNIWNSEWLRGYYVVFFRELH